MDKILLVALDGNRVMDKIKVKKKDIGINALKATGNDSVIIVSKKVADFLDKWN